MTSESKQIKTKKNKKQKQKKGNCSKSRKARVIKSRLTLERFKIDNQNQSIYKRQSEERKIP